MSTGRGTPHLKRCKQFTVRCSLFIIFFFSLTGIFARGKKEEVIDRPVNNGEWVLSITSFDLSSLPASRRIIGEVILRELVNSLNSIDHRIRVSPEYTWYEGYVWAQSRSKAAKALAAKRDERDQLIFRGDPRWRYRRNLKALDLDIKELEEALRKTAAQQPLVAEEPSFRLTEENDEGVFPLPPVDGGEYQFCKKQKADAFLTGSMSEYHGRIYVSLRLYALYTDSYVYEDSVIFSTNDSNAAVNEISGRLAEAISGAKPAEIAIRTEPPDALVLINSSFAGRGGIPRRDYPPGKVTVEIFSANHEPAQAETELKSGEFTEITVNLKPLDLIPVNISAPGKTGVSVYQGVRYVGEAPLTLPLPANQLEYIFAETTEGQSSQAVFLVNEPIAPMAGSGRQVFSFITDMLPKKSTLDNDNNLFLQTRVPHQAEQKRVARARRQYYRAWGTTWITAIAAWMINGYVNSQVDAYNYRGNPEMYDQAAQAIYLNIGGIALVSTAVLVEIIHIGRYVYIAGDDSPPLIK